MERGLGDVPEEGGDSLVSTLLDLEVSAICAHQGRPFADAFADEAGAFDSQGRAEAMVQAIANMD